MLQVLQVKGKHVTGSRLWTTNRTTEQMFLWIPEHIGNTWTTWVRSEKISNDGVQQSPGSESNPLWWTFTWQIISDVTSLSLSSCRGCLLNGSTTHSVAYSFYLININNVRTVSLLTDPFINLPFMHINIIETLNSLKYFLWLHSCFLEIWIVLAHKRLLLKCHNLHSKHNIQACY